MVLWVVFSVELNGCQIGHRLESNIYVFHPGRESEYVSPTFFTEEYSIGDRPWVTKLLMAAANQAPGRV